MICLTWICVFLLQERSRSPASTATERSPTAPTCELTSKPTRKWKGTSVNAASRPSPGSHCCPSTRRRAARCPDRCPDRLFPNVLLQQLWDSTKRTRRSLSGWQNAVWYVCMSTNKHIDDCRDLTVGFILFVTTFLSFAGPNDWFLWGSSLCSVLIISSRNTKKILGLGTFLWWPSVKHQKNFAGNLD